jgi:uncharacterized protein (UPF0332 family)
VDEKLTLAQSELRLAAENLAAAPLLARAGFFRVGISNLYYAAHHAVSALLAAHGLEAGSHEGVQTQFGLHFVKPGALDARAGKYLGNLLHARLTADYKGYIDLDSDDYAQAAAQAKLIIASVTEYLGPRFPELEIGRVQQLAGDA